MTDLLSFKTTVPVLVLFFTSLIALILCVYSCRNRHLKGAYSFAWLMGAIAFWALLNALEMSAQSQAVKIIFGKISYLAVVITGPCELLFALDYSGFYANLRKKYFWMLFIIPVLVLLFVFTNELHHLVWTSFTMVLDPSGNTLIYGHGPVFFINIGYNYLMLLLGSFFFIRFELQRTQKSFPRIALILLALAAPWLANLAYISGITPFPGVDLTTFGFTLTGIFMFLTVFRLQLLQLDLERGSALLPVLLNGVIIIDTEGKASEVNDIAATIIGGRVQKGMPLTEIFQNWPRIIEAATKEGDQTLETYFGNGPRSKWLRVKLAAVHDNNGAANGKLIVLEDITTARTAQKGLAETQSRLADIIDFLPDGTFVLDNNSRVIVWNKAMENLTGVRAQDIVGKDNFAHAMALYHVQRPTLADLVINPDQQLLKKYYNVEIENDRFSAEVNLNLKDGKRAIMWVVTRPLYDSEGNKTGAIETIRDISKQKQFEARIASTEATLSAILENTSDSIIFVDTGFKLIINNQAYTKMISENYHTEVKPGIDTTEFSTSENRDWVLKNLVRALQGEHFIAETVHHFEDGHSKTYEVAYNPVKIDGKVVGISQFIRDITARKQQELEFQAKMDELAHANEIMIGRELKMVDLKNEIAALKEQH